MLYRSLSKIIPAWAAGDVKGPDHVRFLQGIENRAEGAVARSYGVGCGPSDGGFADAGALVTISAEPGREGGEVAAGGDDPTFLIRVPVSA
jgi:hypothetical protein